jgi:hypothetical protein
MTQKRLLSTRRRTLLATASAVLSGAAGCIDSDVFSDSDREARFPFGVAGYAADITVKTTTESGCPLTLEISHDGTTIDDGESMTFEVSMTNTSDEPATFIHWTPPEPFGVFKLRSGDGTTLTPWNDAYETSDDVETSPQKGVLRHPGFKQSTELEPGESIVSTYDLSMESHRVRPGTYNGSLAYEVRQDEGTKSWETAADVRVSLERAGNRPTTTDERSLSATANNVEYFPGRLDVSVLEPITDVTPGAIEVTFRNDGEEKHGFSTYRRFPFGRYVGETTDGDRLVLQSEEMYAPGYIRRDGCWRSVFAPTDAESATFRRQFEPGESISHRYVVLANPEDDCPPAGEYVFKSQYQTEPAGNTTLTSDDVSNNETDGDSTLEGSDLGFTLAVKSE